MGINDLNVQLRRLPRIDREARLLICDEVSRFTSDDSEANRSENTVSIRSYFVATNFGWYPMEIRKDEFN